MRKRQFELTLPQRSIKPLRTRC